MQFQAYDIPVGSPLRRVQPPFWVFRISDDGQVHANSFYSLVKKGTIEVIAPARVLGYADDGESLRLSNGELFRAKVVVLATGYQSSWAPIFAGMSYAFPQETLF
jgi:glycine/D-amino acid oxidase-like deaminating enzyme